MSITEFNLFNSEKKRKGYCGEATCIVGKRTEVAVSSGTNLLSDYFFLHFCSTEV